MVATKRSIVDDTNKIIEYLEEKAPSVVNVIRNNLNNKYFLFQKYISHSDLPTYGKRSGSDKSVDNNILYYLSNDVMHRMQENLQQSGGDMESAKQSNIGVSKEFLEIMGIPVLSRRVGPQKEQHEHVRINDYCKVYLVNESLKYFDTEYTNKVFSALGKNIKWEVANSSLNLSNSEFTEIQLTEAIHGIGTSDDLEFHKLRKHIFKTDSLILLGRLNPSGVDELYIILEKNPIFFTVIGETNNLWTEYLKFKNQQELRSLQNSITVENKEEKSRSLQQKWKDKLAAEMMNYTAVEDHVFCPLTFIEADYKKLKTLYRASHIKRYEDCGVEESFDINNGLLLCANADALFDKHLISIDQNKHLVFSFLLEPEKKLLAELHLNENLIFLDVLNDKRMEYLKLHYQEFLEKEEKRKRDPMYEEELDNLFTGYM